MRSAFRRCYNQALAGDPNIAGAVTLKVVVAPNGDVTSVTPSSPTLPAPLVACLVDRVKKETFDPSDAPWSFSFPPSVHATVSLAPCRGRSRAGASGQPENHGL